MRTSRTAALSRSIRLSFASTLGASLIACCILPSVASAQSDAVAEEAAAPAADSKPQAAEGLPKGMLKVPTNEVRVGLSAEQFVEVLDQTAPSNSDTQKRGVTKLLPSLGQKKVHVAGFLLGQHPVTNEEYMAFVKATGWRFPYHWWRFGEEKDFQEKIPDIRQAYPGQDSSAASVFYWAANYGQLPYKLEDNRGKDISKQPVTYVDRRDAIAYSAWLGMRLPTEAEWIAAARGTGENLFIWGGDQSSDVEDGWPKKESALLKQLKLSSSREVILKDVGATGSITNGPFGHSDMVGQIWEWTANIGVYPVVQGRDYDKEFKNAIKELKKAKLDEVVPDRPYWKDGHGVIKGGAFFSLGSGKMEFAIDMKGGLITEETVPGVGFRVAKSTRPAKDVLISRLQVDYDLSVLLGERKANLNDQIGMERYVFDGDGLVTSYDAVSFAPMNHISEAKNFNARNLGDETATRPAALGVLVLTVPAAEPAIPVGIYTVEFREKGIPRELQDAIKAGVRWVQKNKDKPADKQEEKDEAWTKVVKRFGLTDEDLAQDDAVTAIKYVRVQGFKVPTDSKVLLFRDGQGDYVATIPYTRGVPQTTSYEGATLITGDKGGKTQATIGFAVPSTSKSSRKALVFELSLVLDQAIGEGPTWRVPEVKQAEKEKGSAQKRK